MEGGPAKATRAKRASQDSIKKELRDPNILLNSQSYRMTRCERFAVIESKKKYLLGTPRGLILCNQHALVKKDLNLLKKERVSHIGFSFAGFAARQIFSHYSPSSPTLDFFSASNLTLPSVS